MGRPTTTTTTSTIMHSWVSIKEGLLVTIMHPLLISLESWKIASLIIVGNEWGLQGNECRVKMADFFQWSSHHHNPFYFQPLSFFLSLSLTRLLTHQPCAKTTTHWIGTREHTHSHYRQLSSALLLNHFWRLPVSWASLHFCSLCIIEQCRIRHKRERSVLRLLQQMGSSKRISFSNCLTHLVWYICLVSILLKWIQVNHVHILAVVTVDGEQTHTTTVMKKTLNPYWNESFDL